MGGIVQYLVSSYKHNSLIDHVLRELVNCISEASDSKYSTD